MKYFKFIALIFVIYSCNSNEKKYLVSTPKKKDDFFEINYEDLLTRKQVLELSKIASDVEYIRLETNPNCMIGSMASYFFADSSIFVSNRNHILKFSNSGKFLKKIGNPGRGPGEINMIMNMSLNPEKKVIIVQNLDRRLLYFSFSGDLLKTVTVPFVAYIESIKEGKFIIYNPSLDETSKYTFLLTNENGDTLSSIKNYNSWKRSSGIGISITPRSYKTFHYYNNICLFKSLYNDTVYSVSNNNMLPRYFIRLGKFKLPDNLNPEKLGPVDIKTFWNQSSNYYYANSLEASNQIFLGTFSFGNAEPKCLIFNLENRAGQLLINFDGKSTGFVNDWDGGLDFWPVGNFSDDKVFMPINILKFRKVLEQEDIHGKLIKFPKKQMQLKKLISSLDLLGNPIIMIVSLKKPNV